MLNNLYIFALGNYGDKYKYTRHNAARLVFSGFDFLSTDIVDLGFKIVYHEPKCYMNETGFYIKDFLKNKSINTVFDKDSSRIKNFILFVYDDKDIILGEIKNSFSRSGGGHNGIKNIIEVLGTKDFYSIRIGIKPNIINSDLICISNEKIEYKIPNIKDFVLQSFKKDEINMLTSEVYKDKLKLNLLQILKNIKSNINK